MSDSVRSLVKSSAGPNRSSLREVAAERVPELLPQRDPEGDNQRSRVPRGDDETAHPGNSNTTPNPLFGRGVGELKALCQDSSADPSQRRWAALALQTYARIPELRGHRATFSDDEGTQALIHKTLAEVRQPAP